MKSFRINSKTAVLFMAILFFLHSCTVYKSTPISLDEAAAANRLVKITTTDHKKIKFREIEKTDTTYYGYRTVNNQTVKIQLDKTKIQSIQVENKTVSTILVAIPIALLAAILLSTAMAPSF